MPNNCLKELHNLLAYRPGNGPLLITTSRRDNPPALLVTVNDNPPVCVPKPDAGLDLPFMLARYPAPVFLDGAEIAREAYSPDAGITRIHYEGDIQNAVQSWDKDVGAPLHNTILLQGVLYELDAPGRPLMTVFHDVPDRQDGQPHWARASSYYIQPNYRWNQCAGWSFLFDRRGSRIACLPPPEISEALLPQKVWQDQMAADLIRQRAHISDLGPADHHEFRIRLAPKPETWPAHGVGEAGILPYGEPATLKGCQALSWAAEHCIARAHYRNGNLCLTPVAVTTVEQGEQLPSISCDRVTVVTAQGETLEYAHLSGAFRLDQNYGRVQHVTGAKSITAHLTVSYADGKQRAVDLPLDILLDNEMDYETAFLTSDWQHDRRDELEALLFDAYFDVDREEDESRYRKAVHFLAGNLLSDPEDAFRAELQRLCDDFRSPWRVSNAAPVTVSNERQSITYNPAKEPATV